MMQQWYTYITLYALTCSKLKLDCLLELDYLTALLEYRQKLVIFKLELFYYKSNYTLHQLHYAPVILQIIQNILMMLILFAACKIIRDFLQFLLPLKKAAFTYSQLSNKQRRKMSPKIVEFIYQNL